MTNIRSCVALCPYQGTNWTIEAIQKGAIHIILNFSRGMPYNVDVNCSKPDYSGLSQRENLKKIFFSILLNPLHTCNTSREPSVISRLRTYTRNILEFTLEPNVTAPLSIMQGCKSVQWNQYQYQSVSVYHVLRNRPFTLCTDVLVSVRSVNGP